MTDYTPEFWLQAARTENFVVDIGQIDKAAARLLDKHVKSGELMKYRGCWFSGSDIHCVGKPKTIWRRAA